MAGVGVRGELPAEQQADRLIDGLVSLRRVCSLVFPAGGTLLFISCRVVAEESGAADPGRFCWPTAGLPANFYFTYAVAIADTR